MDHIILVQVEHPLKNLVKNESFVFQAQHFIEVDEEPFEIITHVIEDHVNCIFIEEYFMQLEQ